MGLEGQLIKNRVKIYLIDQFKSVLCADNKTFCKSDTDIITLCKQMSNKLRKLSIWFDTYKL